MRVKVLVLISCFNSSKKLHFGPSTSSRSIISREIFTAKFSLVTLFYLYTGTRQGNEPGSKLVLIIFVINHNSFKLSDKI